MKSKYTGPKNQAKNQTVPISIEDPRLSWLKIGQTKARTGAEIEIVNLAKSLGLLKGGIFITKYPKWKYNILLVLIKIIGSDLVYGVLTTLSQKLNILLKKFGSLVSGYEKSLSILLILILNLDIYNIT